MNTSINNQTTFNGIKLHVSKDVNIPKERVKNVGKILNEISERYGDKDLFVGKDSDPFFETEMYSLKKADESGCSEFLTTAIYYGPLSEVFEKFSDKEIAKRFLRIFKILGTEEKFDILQQKFDNAKLDLLSKYRANKSKANRYAEQGKKDFAWHYDMLAHQNMMKIRTMKNELKAADEKRIDIISKITEKDDELSFLAYALS